MSDDAPVRLGLLFLGRRPAWRFVEVARRAEAAGFDDFWVPDERFFREVYSLCTLVAGVTERVRIGPCVTDPYTRHPALTAMAIATLDELSGGRAALGLGAGVSGMAELGINQHRPARAVGEAIDIVRALLTGERVVYQGRVFAFDGRLDFTPARADVPVYVAAAGPRMLTLSGSVADGVIIEGCVSPGSLESAVDQVDHGLLTAGRTREQIDVAARIDVAVDDDLNRAYDALRPRVARYLTSSAPDFARFRDRGLEVPEELGALAQGVGYTHDPAALGPVARALPTEFIDAFCIAATPATLGARLDDLRDRGATQILVNAVAVDDLVEPVIDAVGRWAGRC
jgi:5,10-methylenetetrahydromethanopterin reductase